MLQLYYESFGYCKIVINAYFGSSIRCVQFCKRDDDIVSDIVTGSEQEFPGCQLALDTEPESDFWAAGKIVIAVGK